MKRGRPEGAELTVVGIPKTIKEEESGGTNIVTLQKTETIWQGKDDTGMCHLEKINGRWST